MCQYLPEIILLPDHWKIKVFSRFIGVEWSLTHETTLTINN